MAQRTFGRVGVWILFAGILASAAVPAGAKTVVRLMLWGDGKAYEPIIEAFEQKYPDIEVEVELTSFGNYFDRLQIQAAAGVAADVIRVNGAFLGGLAAAGIIEEMQPWIDAAGIDLDEYMPTGDIFWYKGKLYGLGNQYDLVGLLYNKDAFSARGLTAPADDWTWAELRDAAARLTVRSDEHVEQYGVTMYANATYWGQASWVNFLAQNGVRILDESKSRAAFNTPAGIEAIEFMRSFVVEDRSAPPVEQVYAWEFGQAKVAMDFTIMPNSFQNLRESASFEWNIAPLPVGKERAAVTNTVGFALNATSQVKEAAWTLIEFLVTEGQMIAGRDRLFMPTYRPAVFEYIDPNEAPTRFLDVLNVSSPYAVDLQFTPSWSQWSSVLGTRISEAVSGTRSVESALEEAQRQVNAILADES